MEKTAERIALEDPPLVDESSMVLRHPAVPVTLEELAALKSAAQEIIEARVTVVETLRAKSIRMTVPTDWVLYKAPEEQGGQIVGYCQQCGVERWLPIWGIGEFDLQGPERIEGAEPNSFSIRWIGSGRSNLTGTEALQIIGTRSSTEKVVEGLTGPQLEDKVIKNARANLSGNIGRRIAGINQVPAEEIARVFATCNPPKDIEQCRRGRGFGTREERQGRGAAPNVPPPTCGVCGTAGVWRPGKDGKPDFYFCPEHAKHPAGKKWFLDAPKWIAQQEAKTGAAAKRAEAELAKRPCSICGVAKDQHTGKDHDWDDPGEAR
jgi:hypothetical protein